MIFEKRFGMKLIDIAGCEREGVLPNEISVLRTIEWKAREYNCLLDKFFGRAKIPALATIAYAILC